MTEIAPIRLDGLSQPIWMPCLLFARVHVSQANVDQIPGGEERLHPRKSWDIWHL